MAEVSLFKGIRYNKEIVKDLANVICPPYDIITPQQQKIYYEKSDYNAIRLEYIADQLGDNAINNKYSKTASTFQSWLRDGVLLVDDCPAFYLHDHYFTHLGKERRRRGLIARVKLEPWYGEIYPHEETFSKVKRDRLQLMRTCHANFSSIFTLYQDLEGRIAGILNEASQGKPIIELSDSGESHVVWMITEPKFSQEIIDFFARRTLYVADGHHRYETALAYQSERIHTLKDIGQGRSDTFPTGEEAFNFIMMTLVDFSDSGLITLPIHRLVRGIAPTTLSGLREKLNEFFTLEYVSFTGSLIDSVKYKMIGGALLGILGLETGSLVLLKKRHDLSIDDVMPKGHSQDYNNLNVSILAHIILGRMLGFSQDSEDIAYTVDADEACRQVKEGKYQLAFLLGSLQPEMVKNIADARERMPRKSTYFYPKLPTGLVINYLC